MKKSDLKKTIQLAGRKPINPIGQCFESAIRQLLFAEDAPENARLCHGIGVANMPGQEGNRMGHAWVEFDYQFTRLAIDTTWGVTQIARVYREKGQLKYVKEYSKGDAWALWKKHNMPGPWCPEIVAAVNERRRQGD